MRFLRSARDVIPYGVNSNFRYWGDDDTLVITHGEGAYVWDADGKRYIDYRLGFGPIILGHAYPSCCETGSGGDREAALSSPGQHLGRSNFANGSRGCARLIKCV